jgi:hypothetical protein
MMGLREDTLKTLSDLPGEIVETHGLRFEVRGLTVRDANGLYDRLSKRVGDTVEVDREKWNAEWCIASVFDPDTGERVFDPADRDSLLAGRADLVQVLAQAAARLSGFGGDEDAARRLKSEPA